MRKKRGGPDGHLFFCLRITLLSSILAVCSLAAAFTCSQLAHGSVYLQSTRARHHLLAVNSRIPNLLVLPQEVGHDAEEVVEFL